MKFRPDDTMSERQLVQALAQSGRAVALNLLTAWRKDGLLPPLASTGTGSGRTYYWREIDILEQAQTVHDGLSRHGRTDILVVSLFLCGFTVPLPQLRRAWQSCIRLRKAPTVHRRAAASNTATPANLSQLILQAMLTTGASVQLNDKPQPALVMLEAAAARLDLAVAHGAQLQQLWQMAQMVTTVLVASDVMRQADDEELLRAQALLRTTLRFVEESSGESTASVAEVLGETLFLFILTHLRAGQEDLLESAKLRIEAVRRFNPVRPHPKPLYARA